MSRGRPAKRRAQMLDYVRDEIAREGRAPSYGMICGALGIRSREQVSRMVQAAERARHNRMQLEAARRQNAYQGEDA